ncbi:MAG TPA: hypothetical protein PKA00_17820 [Saprospiraceae bacterium]|nr:hypothetical protein [Saprospiraceae bacterium]HMQ84781.1 hypothetical protein [Saprospiraceae bacterium]
MRKIVLSLLGIFALTAAVFGRVNPERQAPVNNNGQVSYRENCTAAKAQIDQAINNIRARLTTGGDVWWDGSDGRYIAPKVPPGVPEVSSIFAGAVWLGGVDDGQNLKVAAQTYGRSGGGNDYWPGPLNPNNALENPGGTDQETCSNWDAFFVVTAEEIDEHLRLYNESIEKGIPYDPTMIPKGVRGWPGKGNPFFFEVNDFELPSTQQGLAGFQDNNGDFLYNPLDGDFPVIEIRGCEDETPQYPDEMIFWIYNDNGNIHSESNADPIGMEIQVQAFAYATNDQLNNMTFQRFKLINRAIEPIDSTFFAMWVDADLGCDEDDNIGCDTLRSLMYIYNSDVLDGNPGCSCPSGAATYCDEIPLLGIDYFRGPQEYIYAADGVTIVDSVELGMSAFTYYNRPGVGPWPPEMEDPNGALEHYRYLTGSWRDGSPFTYGGSGYGGTEPINYAFTEAPDDPNGWSMCTAGLEIGDRRTIQASGPFRLEPGAVNELIVGMVWIPEASYPCPDIKSLQSADDISQALFDNCFDITDGPDAPDLDIIELDQEFVIIMTNDPVTSNNAFEAYSERGLEIPETTTDTNYVFEGYKLYQLKNSSITLSPETVNDPTKVRLIAQVDIKNGVDKVFNWNPVDDSPLDFDYLEPELMVNGQDQGIRHTFRITQDAFAEGNARALINHRKYYFVAVAYGFNDYEPFDPIAVAGQKKPYLEGRGNIGDDVTRLPYYTAIPRPITDRQLRSDYGDGAVITRLDGIGSGGVFLNLSDDTRAAMEEAFAKNEPFAGDLVYAEGQGPILVQVYNPIDVVDGEFELRFVDDNMDDEVLETDARWELTNLGTGEVIASERTIEELNEQIIKEYGFTISIGQVDEPGAKTDDNNGYVGFSVDYKEESGDQWLGYIPEGVDFTPIGGDNFMFDYISTAFGQADDVLDPEGGLTQFGQTPFMPYYILDWRSRDLADSPFLGPVWANNSASGVVRGQSKASDINNVDIVFTSNKDLWSRCVIIESANRFYTDAGFQTEGEYGQFDLRKGLSVGKDDTDDDGLPDQDGALDGSNPQEGMGWFPGYAVDVETGQRLNVFFGENSVYDGSLLGGAFTQGATGRDMMFNPTSDILLTSDLSTIPYPYVVGCQHMVYVTKTAYDECELFRVNFKKSASPFTKVKAVKEITWAGMIVMAPDTRMKSYAEGLIPNDVTVKMRVTNSYQVEKDDGDDDNGDQRTGSGQNNYHPMYRFKIEGKQALPLDEIAIENALDFINIVPNPYYGFSDYETSQFTTTVKITNLPAKCVVTIYTLDGKFIRQYNRDEVGIVPEGETRGIVRRQITPDLEWDLKNDRAIPVASGVYLVHVAAEGLGERTLKWFGVGRQFDPSGL